MIGGSWSRRSSSVVHFERLKKDIGDISESRITSTLIELVGDQHSVKLNKVHQGLQELPANKIKFLYLRAAKPTAFFSNEKAV